MDDYLYNLSEDDVGRLVENVVVQILVDLLGSLPEGRASMSVMQAKIDHLLSDDRQYSSSGDGDDNFGRLVLRSLDMKLRTQGGPLSSKRGQIVPFNRSTHRPVAAGR